MGVFLELKDIKVRSLDLDFHELTWELVNTRAEVLDYTFQVLRSESPEGPFDPVSKEFTDQYLFIDNVLQVANRWRKYFYIIRVKEVRSGDTKDFGPVSRDPDPELLAKELRVHMQTLFREFAGRRCWVLPVRTFGQRCKCWNETLSARRRSGCKGCYDTGFVRGYMSPIESWVQVDPSPKTEQVTNVGQQQQSNTTARLAWYPPLKPRDVLIEGENRRWRVTQVNQTELGRAAVYQEVQLHEIPPRDIEFSIPIRLDVALKDLWISPARNFSNPQNLESFMQEEIPKIFNLYPSTYPKPK